jgi:predicted nucleic acid-binding protein
VSNWRVPAGIAPARRSSRTSSAPFQSEYDLEVARAHTSLLAHVRRSDKPRGADDLIIAATAAATGRSVVTLDVHGFEDLPGVATL